MNNTDVRLGDKVRITRTNVYEGVVSGITDFGLDLDGGRYYRTCDVSESVEILVRAPRTFAVGDKVDVKDFELLPHGTILFDADEAVGTPRFVDARWKKIIIDTTDTFAFSFYTEGSFSGYNFVVAYLPVGGK